MKSWNVQTLKDPLVRSFLRWHIRKYFLIFFFSSSTESTADQHQPSYNSNNHETSDGSSEPFFDPLADDNPDRSYQFSYGSNEEDASREEVSDAKGEKKLRLIFFSSQKDAARQIGFVFGKIL